MNSQLSNNGLSRKWTALHVLGDTFYQIEFPILPSSQLLYYSLLGTIFAYGQTGTGKTFTMEGDISENLYNHTVHCHSIIITFFKAL